MAREGGEGANTSSAGADEKTVVPQFVGVDKELDTAEVGDLGRANQNLGLSQADAPIVQSLNQPDQLIKLDPKGLRDLTKRLNNTIDLTLGSLSDRPSFSQIQSLKNDSIAMATPNSVTPQDQALFDFALKGKKTSV